MIHDKLWAFLHNPTHKDPTNSGPILIKSSAHKLELEREDFLPISIGQQYIQRSIDRKNQGQISSLSFKVAQFDVAGLVIIACLNCDHHIPCFLPGLHVAKRFGHFR